MKKLTAFTVTGIILVTLMLPTLSVRQAIAKPVFQDTAEVVEAFWPDAQIQVGEFTLANIQLEAFTTVDKGVKETTVHLSYELYQDDTLLCLPCEAELTTTDDDVLQINGFKSATLSPVTLDVCVAFDINFNCTESFPITLQAEWEGFGSLESGKIDIQTREFNAIFHGTTRDATATGSINGEDLGQSIEALIFHNNINFNTHGSE